jgi:TRAP-type mannitol/chloroaromatic compound transport system substrate-binding protein
MLDTLDGIVQHIIQRVSELTEERFQITLNVDPLKGAGVLEAVQAGTVQCGHTIAHYYLDRNPAFAFGSGVPFGLTPSQQQSWLYDGGGLEVMQRVYADFKTIAFPAANTGMQMGGWFKTEVNTLADLQGLKMRIAGLGAEILSRLGVRPHQLPPTEIFAALQENQVDAAEWIGPYDDEHLELYKVAPYYYYPGWWEPGSSCDLIIHQEAWAKLPLHYQQILQIVAAEADSLALARYNRKNPQALSRLLDKGTQLRPFSSDILKACQTETAARLEEIAAKSSSFKTDYLTWQRFRNEAYRWSSISDLALGSFSFTPLPN